MQGETLMNNLYNHQVDEAQRLLNELRNRVIATGLPFVDIAGMAGMHYTTLTKFLQTGRSISFNNYCSLIMFCRDVEEMSATQYDIYLKEKDNKLRLIKKRNASTPENATV